MGETLAPAGHIVIDSTGEAWIEHSNTKVVEIALDHLAHGWSPEEIHYQHYGQVSMAQIHAALAYYYDHKREMDERISREGDEVDARRLHQGASPLVARLKAEGRLK
ncbi:MAG: DUF433 domain-containing protein [Acidobacteriota bacterium]